MSEEEETVFETLNRTLSEIRDSLDASNEALVVIAIELYESRREFTDIIKKMNTLLGKLLEMGVQPEVKEVSAVQDEERFKELVFPKSTLPKAEGEGK